MFPFSTYVLRSYHRATGWNDDNLYSNLTRSSDVILDFTVPRGFHVSFSKAANPLFNTSCTMGAVPSLNGAIGYIFTSCPLNLKSSGAVPFKSMVDRFRVYDQPRRPEPREEEWLAGERVDKFKRDYLLYGQFYLPTRRLDALYSVRLSQTIQAMVVAISDRSSMNAAARRVRGQDASNVMFSLQHDVGKWCTEYTYSAEDGMYGVRVLHNFGRLGPAGGQSGDLQVPKERAKRIDEEDATDGGLKGRVSVGAELYISAKEKSAGVSTGVRFTTLPDATPPSLQPNSPKTGAPPQPPTTITALFNPMLGHLTAAYSAKVSPDLAISSRFAFNVYSYESEWTMGTEFWTRKNVDSVEEEQADLVSGPTPTAEQPVYGVFKARASTNNDVSLVWEGRLGNMLASMGVTADLASRSKPIKTIGLALSYFSSSSS